MKEDNGRPQTGRTFVERKVVICFRIYKSKEKISQKLEEDLKCDGRDVSLTGYVNKHLLE